MSQKTAVIIGAGPAGLTAAYELLTKTDIKPVIYEMSSDIGGISRTVNYKGNRIDIGGHRFSSPSEEVMEWWRNILPLQGAPARDDIILQRSPALSPIPGAPDPEKVDKVLLTRGRVSRVFSLGSFFDYPVSFKYSTFKKLGLTRTMKTGLSYVKASMFPIRHEASLEDFFINRFGREFYLAFYKDYTEKIWGVPCREIQPDWGARRIKGQPVSKSVLRSLKTALSKGNPLDRDEARAPLIEQFMYPKLGPGQLWKEVAQRVLCMGGIIRFKHRAIGFDTIRGNVVSARILDTDNNEVSVVGGDYFFSTMPVSELIAAMNPDPPEEVRSVAEGLVYRDFITVGMLLKKLQIRNDSDFNGVNATIPDNWINIQERGVRLGRLQIFNNWSPYLVKDPGTVWLGLEYFCTVGDDLWSKPDPEFAAFAVSELSRIGIIEPEDVIDHVVIRVPKISPAYFGTYSRFGVVRDYADSFGNLFLVGRNGMHRYNNADHSMLTAMAAVRNIVEGSHSKENLWLIKIREGRHEPKEE